MIRCSKVDRRWWCYAGPDTLFVVGAISLINEGEFLKMKGFPCFKFEQGLILNVSKIKYWFFTTG